MSEVEGTQVTETVAEQAPQQGTGKKVKKAYNDGWDEQGQSLKGARNVMLVVAIILSATMYEINTSSMTVLVASIAGEMIPKGMLPTQVGWIISIPAFFMIPGCLLGMFLVRRVKVRTIVVITWALYALAGMGIYWMNTVFGIFACRGIMGLCIGLSEPMAKVLPARIYSGERRSKVLGWLGFGGGGLSVITSFVVGQVGLIGWRWAMFIYPVYAIIFIVVILAFAPDLPVEKHEDKEKEKNEKKRPFGFTVWVMCIAGFIMYVVCAVIQIETSVHVQELGLGGSNVASYVSMSNTVGIIIGAFLFGYLYEHIKRWLFPLGLAFSAVFYFWFANATSLWQLCLAGCLANIFTISNLCTYTLTRASFAAPRERMTQATTIVALFWYFGQTLTTPFVNFCQAHWGATAAVPLNCVGVVFAVFAVVSAIFILCTRNMKLTAKEKYGYE